MQLWTLRHCTRRTMRWTRNYSSRQKRTVKCANDKTRFLFSVTLHTIEYNCRMFCNNRDLLALIIILFVIYALSLESTRHSMRRWRHKQICYSPKPNECYVTSFTNCSFWHWYNSIPIKIVATKYRILRVISESVSFIESVCMNLVNVLNVRARVKTRRRAVVLRGA